MSLHGVGLSLGSTDEINVRHLEKLKRLVVRFEPWLISEHLCWSSVGGRYLNDLLPLPYTEEALAHVVPRIAQVQDYLGRQILIENLSSYLEYAESTMPEWEFLVEVSRRSGCGVLLDVNNIYVSAKNHGFDGYAYVARIPGELVHEIHLAGFSVNRFVHGNGSGEILIDTHSKPVAEEVWRLYRWTVDRTGRKPMLIEWDSALPQLERVAERGLPGRSHSVGGQCPRGVTCKSALPKPCWILAARDPSLTFAPTVWTGHGGCASTATIS